MKKVFGLFAILTVALFFFLVSVAGENNRTESISDEFLSDLTNENFRSECIKIIVNGSPTPELNCEQDMFIFSVSLLKRFELLGAKRFHINVKRENIWFPFILNEGIRVSANLSIDEESMFNVFSSNIDYVEDIFVIKRSGFKWDMDTITINEPKLATIFSDTKKQVDFDKFLVQINSGYQLKEVSIHDGEFTDIDQLLLKYSMDKLLGHFTSQKPNKQFKSDS